MFEARAGRGGMKSRAAASGESKRCQWLSLTRKLRGSLVNYSDWTTKSRLIKLRDSRPAWFVWGCRPESFAIHVRVSRVIRSQLTSCYVNEMHPGSMWIGDGELMAC